MSAALLGHAAVTTGDWRVSVKGDSDPDRHLSAAATGPILSSTAALGWQSAMSAHEHGQPSALLMGARLLHAPYPTVATAVAKALALSAADCDLAHTRARPGAAMREGPLSFLSCFLSRRRRVSLCRCPQGEFRLMEMRARTS